MWVARDCERLPTQVKQGSDFAFNPVLAVQEGETVYDFDWYPMMHVTSPGSCLFVTTTRERPVHLWDAFTGKVCSRTVIMALWRVSRVWCVAADLLPPCVCVWPGGGGVSCEPRIARTTT